MENLYRNNQLKEAKKTEHEENVDLFANLSQLPRPHIIAPFPRKKPGTQDPFCNIALMELTSSETLEVKAYAESTAKKLLKETTSNKGEENRGYDEIYNECCAIGVLWHACRKEDNLEQKFFPNRESIHKVLTIDEISILYNHFLTLKYTKGPVISNMNEQEMDNLIDKLIDGGTDSTFFLSFISVELLKDLLITMAKALKNAQGASSSVTSLPSDGIMKETKKRKKERLPV